MAYSEGVESLLCFVCASIIVKNCGHQANPLENPRLIPYSCVFNNSSGAAPERYGLICDNPEGAGYGGN
jgi:hypothetical protein